MFSEVDFHHQNDEGHAIKEETTTAKIFLSCVTNLCLHQPKSNRDVTPCGKTCPLHITSEKSHLKVDTFIRLLNRPNFSLALRYDP